MIGPGKYDAACTSVREATKAAGVILIVISGEHGFGFEVQIPPQLQEGFPKVLRDVADQIEHDYKHRQ